MGFTQFSAASDDRRETGILLHDENASSGSSQMLSASDELQTESDLHTDLVDSSDEDSSENADQVSDNLDSSGFASL